MPNYEDEEAFREIPVEEVLAHLKKSTGPRMPKSIAGGRLKIGMFTEGSSGQCLIVDVDTKSWAKAVEGRTGAKVRASLKSDGTALVMPAMHLHL